MCIGIEFLVTSRRQPENRVGIPRRFGIEFLVTSRRQPENRVGIPRRADAIKNIYGR